MGMLSSWLQKLRPLELQDDFFGRLTYIKMPKDRISYWEAARVFSPTDREIDVLLNAPAPGQPPQQRHREFFSVIENRFKEVLASAETILRPKFEAWAGRPLSQPFETEFTMVGFSIPCAPLDQATWDMSFESKTDAHLFTVYFHGLVATEVSIDG